MFHIDMTFEDCRMIATPVDSGYNLHICEYITGQEADIVVSAKQLGYIAAINFDPNGTPDGVEEMYKSLEPLFLNLDQSLRPIP